MIAELATVQHGVAARWQLLALGLDKAAVQRRLDSGRLHQLQQGVYAVGHRRVSQHARWMAAVLAGGERAVLSHVSAAVLWRLADTRGTRIHITVPHGDGGGRARRGMTIHRTRGLDAVDRAERFSIPVTGPSRTLCDLAGVASFAALREAFDAAENVGVLDLARLVELCDERRGCRGIGRIRSLVARYRPLPLTRSWLERRFLRLCDEAGIPRPAVNVDVQGYEVDCYWPDAGVVVELDGYGHHRDPQTFESDRRRDIAMQLAGLTALRFTYRRVVNDPAKIVAEVQAARARRSRQRAAG